MPNPMDAMCWVSPADEKGNIDNLLTRVSRLEEIIALLTGMDISALQLSDISSNGGVLQNMAATASNAAGGWTTDGTFTGVALSTLGWKMSDGNEFPIVLMQDGVLQFGFNKDGTMSGTKVDQWDNWSAPDYAARWKNISGNGSTSRGIDIVLVNITNSLSQIEFKTTRAGLYFVAGHFSIEIDTGGTAGGTVNSTFQITFPSFAGSVSTKTSDVIATGGAGRTTASLMQIAQLGANESMLWSVNASLGGSAGSLNAIDLYSFSAVRVAES